MTRIAAGDSAREDQGDRGHDQEGEDLDGTQAADPGGADRAKWLDEQAYTGKERNGEQELSASE